MARPARPVGIGVDIGATEVRVVAVSAPGPDGLAPLTRFGSAPVPVGAITAAGIEEVTVVAEAIVAAWAQAGLRKQPAVVGMTTPQVALAKVTLPVAVKPTERLEALRWQVGTGNVRLPSGDDTNYALRELSRDDRTVTFAVVAVPTAEVARAADVCRLAGLNVAAVDLSANALMRSMVRTAGPDPAAHTIVDLGAVRATTVTRVGDLIRSVRTTLAGGEDITEALAARLGLSRTDAEARKRTVRLGARDAAALAAEGTADSIVEQIAQSVEADRDRHGALTTGITLVGGGGLLPGVKSRLAQRVGAPVVIGEPWVKLGRHRSLGPLTGPGGQVAASFVPKLPVAVGLALWAPPR